MTYCLASWKTPMTEFVRLAHPRRSPSTSWYEIKSSEISRIWVFFYLFQWCTLRRRVEKANKWRTSSHGTPKMAMFSKTVNTEVRTMECLRILCPRFILQKDLLVIFLIDMTCWSHVCYKGFEHRACADNWDHFFRFYYPRCFHSPRLCIWNF